LLHLTTVAGPPCRYHFEGELKFLLDLASKFGLESVDTAYQLAQ
jgi:hypothetical protein